MARKENLRVALTKRLLKDALTRLLLEKDIEKISISELCQTAGINRTTFYHHYGSQYDLLRELEQDMTADIERLHNQDGGTAPWSVSKWTETMCTYFREHERETKAFLRIGQLSEILQSSYIETPHEHFLPGIEDSNAQKLVCTFFTNGICCMLSQWMMEDFPITPKEMGKLVDSIVPDYLKG